MNSLHSYYPILPAKRGEFKAYKNLTNHIRNHIMPIFELPVGDSDISTLNFVNKKLNSLTKIILSTKNHNLAIDTYYYSINNQILENGRHIYEYIYSELRQSKLNVIPIIGYDRWYNSIDPTYKNTISVIDFSEAPYFIIRLDGEALDHLDEPDFFKEQIDNILNGLKIESINCLFLIDFKSIAKKSLPTILEKAYQAVEVLEEIENLGISISGCSIPETINQAIDTPDTSGLFLRKENLVWKSLKKDFSNINLKYSDYGVKAPSGKESIPAGNNANGKIRYTTDNNYFIARGHAIGQERNFSQMHLLAKEIVDSIYFEDNQDCWADVQIKKCSLKEITSGNHETWITIDTNHHLTYIVEEIVLPSKIQTF